MLAVSKKLELFDHMCRCMFILSDIHNYTLFYIMCPIWWY